MNTRPFYCPDCHEGTITVRHFSGDPQLEESFDCPECHGTGLVRLDPDSRKALLLERAPYDADFCDPLVAMARARIVNRRSFAYSIARMRAMRPVSGLAQADMLAMARRCVNRVDALRGAA